MAMAAIAVFRPHPGRPSEFIKDVARAGAANPDDIQMTVWPILPSNGSTPALTANPARVAGIYFRFRAAQGNFRTQNGNQP